MSERTDPGEWHTTTDHDRVKDWASARDAVPVLLERPDAEPGLRIATKTDEAHGERISWDRFFELFEEEQKAFRYREREPGTESKDDYGLVDRTDSRHGIGERSGVERGTAEPSEAESDQIATSDTGDREPVAYEPSESGPSDADDGDRDGRTETPSSESERGSVEGENVVVLDEINEHSIGPTEWRNADEYVVFENVSEAPVDLSGWTVENEAGRSYRFDDGTTLEPGGQITLHSNDGEDTEDERYWGSDEPIWQTAGDTVVLRTPTGRRVVEESYKGGR